MIPEPITAISMATGLLGFILTTALNTIEQIYLTRDALKEHHARLIAHKYVKLNVIIVFSLAACLDSWQRT